MFLNRINSAVKLGRALYKTRLGKGVAKAYDYVADRAHLALTKGGRKLNKELTAMGGVTKEKVLKVPGLVRSKRQNPYKDVAGAKAEFAGQMSAVRRANRGIVPRQQPNKGLIPRKKNPDAKKDRYIEGYNQQALLYKKIPASKGPMAPTGDTIEDRMTEATWLGNKYKALFTTWSRLRLQGHAYEQHAKFGKAAVGAAGAASAGAGFAAGSAYLKSKKNK